MKNTVVVTAFFLAFAVPGLAHAAQARGTNISADLEGFNEVPSVLTKATGTFKGTISSDQKTITYTLTYQNLQGTVTQSHIHIAQPAVNGSIVLWLCQTQTNPAPVGNPPTCPQSGTVTGTLTSDDVIAGSITTQQINAGDLADVITAIKEGFAYANVHTSPLSPGGEIRGQITTGRR